MWDADWDGAHKSPDLGHPTSKPLELWRRPLAAHVPPGGLVLDSFGGSGTALIAAAQTGRRAALVELEPVFCDVIRRRWTAFATSQGEAPGPGALAP